MTADPWEPWSSDLDAAIAADDEPRLAALLEDLWRVPLRQVRARDAARWDHLFEILLAQLGSQVPRLRSLALHYLDIVMGTEYGPPFADGPGGHSRDDRRRALERRTAQLLPALGAAVRRGTVALPRAVDDLVHLEERGDVPPQDVVVAWIAEVAPSAALARAARIAYLDGRAPWQVSEAPGETAEQALWRAMDDADVLVRAYAARALGRRYCEQADAEQGAAEQEDGLAPLAEAVAALTAREIERPGIAGPFFSNWYSPGGGLEAFERAAGIRLEEWMLRLLAERRGPEPDTLPCSNGIDFFAHELFGGQAGTIERLLALGHEEIAIEAATEIDERIDDLVPVLVELAAREDAEVCRRASWHLASHHRVLDPNGARRGFVARAERDGVELFVERTGPPEAGGYAYAAVVFPPAGGAFDEAAAAAALACVLPEAMRGPQVPYGLPSDEADGAFVRARSRNVRFACGALVEWRGDLAAGRCERLRVLWHGPPGAWNPTL